MTIAAGFVCKGSVVLGADSEVTRGFSAKTYEDKIKRVTNDGSVYLTYSGDVDAVSEIVRQAREATGMSTDPDVAFEAIKELYLAHIASDAAMPAEERMRTELLVVVRRDMRHLLKAEIDFIPTLYHLRGDRVTVVQSYAVLGIGADVAHAVFDSTQYWLKTWKETMVVAIDGIRRIKASVLGCGGTTNVLAITGHPIWFQNDLSRENVRLIEADCEILERQFRLISGWLAQSKPEDRLAENLEVLKQQLLAHRDSRASPLAS